MNTSNFEQLRIPQLENIHRGVTHKLEVLQEKMAGDMGRSTYYDILPRNFPNLPVEKCSIHDLKLLEELHEKSFDVYWTLEHKKAEENDTLEAYYASFKFYSFRDCLTDDELNEFFVRCEAYCNQRMSTQKIIQALMEAPNFIEEVMA